MSLKFAAYVVPAATLAVVNDFVVPSFLNSVKTIVPGVAVAPPPEVPNGSLVVFEIAIPVLKPGTTTAYVINNVVCDGGNRMTGIPAAGCGVSWYRGIRPVANPVLAAPRLVKAVPNGPIST